MADFTIEPLPPKSGLSLGFWIDLKAQLATAISTLEENTVDADSSDSSASPADIPFDPDTATVTELLTGIDTVIDSLEGS